MLYLKNTLILLLLSVISFSCSKDDDDLTASRILQLGTWRVNLYVDSGIDETQSFAGYQFSFADNGVITVNKEGVNAVTGSYTTEVDNSQNKLRLNFGTRAVFSELNEDWRIVEKTNSRIRLEHVSGGSGGTDLLTFDRL